MRKIWLVLHVVMLLAACGKQIDDIKPLTKIDQEGEMASVPGIQDATNGAYSQLGITLTFTQDLGENRGNNVTLRQWAPVAKNSDAFFYRNSALMTEGQSYEFYMYCYRAITGVNSILEGIRDFEQSPRLALLSEADRNMLQYLKGENLFVRAMVYFNLVRVFGKPYYLNPETNTAVQLKQTSDIREIPGRSTLKESYDFIIRDLDAAAQLMKVPVTKTNLYASTGAAWALLSRVYLYKGGSVTNPDNAANQKVVLYADSVINHTNGKYALLQGTAYKNMFAEDLAGALGRVNATANKEIIFAFDYRVTASGIGPMYHYDPLSATTGVFKPSSDLIQQFTSGDVRGTFFYNNTASGSVETSKWLVANTYSLTRAPYIFVRTGEVYLNRAEAAAKMGNLAQARSDLKAIHTRAGLPVTDIDNLADNQVLTSILKERRLELAFEGQNSFEYFRNGLPMVRKAADNNGTELIVQPNDDKVTFPIPLN